MNALDLLVDFAASISTSKVSNAINSNHEAPEPGYRMQESGLDRRATVSLAKQDVATTTLPQVQEQFDAAINLQYITTQSSPQHHCASQAVPLTTAPNFSYLAEEAYSKSIRELHVRQSNGGGHQELQHTFRDYIPAYCELGYSASAPEQGWDWHPRRLPEIPSMLMRNIIPPVDCICGDANCHQRYLSIHDQPMSNGYIPAYGEMQNPNGPDYNKRLTKNYWASVAPVHPSYDYRVSTTYR